MVILIFTMWVLVAIEAMWILVACVQPRLAGLAAMISSSLVMILILICLCLWGDISAIMAVGTSMLIFPVGIWAMLPRLETRSSVQDGGTPSVELIQRLKAAFERQGLLRTADQLRQIEDILTRARQTMGKAAERKFAVIRHGQLLRRSDDSRPTGGVKGRSR